MFCRPIVVCLLNCIIELLRWLRAAATFLKGLVLASPVLNHSKTLIQDNLHIYKQFKVIFVVIFPSLKQNVFACATPQQQRHLTPGSARDELIEYDFLYTDPWQS